MASRRLQAATIAAAAALLLAACESGDDHEADQAQRPAAAPGGTLVYYSNHAVFFTDPQRMVKARDVANFGRTVYRSLVAFPASDDVGVATTAVPDLATDTGTSRDGARIWSFTLKDGVTWEDGGPITCADLRYGASRAFATDVIVYFGENYLLDYLDVPDDPKTGDPAYQGPYAGVGQKLFDRAVTCAGTTITYHFKKPWPDFPLWIASSHVPDPYRADKDHGEDSAYEVFANGPYRVEGGAWDEHNGGILVRNEHYDPATDSPELRRALPDRIVFDTSRSVKTITERMIADRGPDQTAVTDERIPATYRDRITGEVAGRAVTVTSPFVDYLLPNFRRLTNPLVRQALAVALDHTGLVAAGGGDTAYQEATDLVNPTVRGYQEDLFPGGPGDAETARTLLESAGVPIPYPITFTFPMNDSRFDKRASAIKAGWDRAGFAVRLSPLADGEFYASIGNPHLHADVMFAGWGADWPSAITVIPTLFDSRINLTEDSNGQDYGGYRSPRFEKLVDAAEQAADLDTQTALLQQADQVLRDDVAYLPLDVPVFHLLRGSRVTGYAATAATSAYPDLGQIGVR